MDQIVKLGILEFYYNILEKYVDRRDFQYMYFLGEEVWDVVRPKLLVEYDKDLKIWVVTVFKWHGRAVQTEIIRV